MLGWVLLGFFGDRREGAKQNGRGQWSNKARINGEDGGEK